MRKYVYGVRCPRCWDNIYSLSRHHMKYCFCGYCYVDGGMDYVRCGWGGGPEFPGDEKKYGSPVTVQFDQETGESADWIPDLVLDGRTDKLEPPEGETK